MNTSLAICHNLAHRHITFAPYSNPMTDKKLQEYFPDLSVIDFKLLCNIAYHGEIPGSYTLRNIASRSRVNVDKINESLARLRNTPYLQGTKVSPRYFFKVVKVMMDNIPQWEDSFKRMQQFRYETAKYLWNFAKKVAQENWKGAASLKRPSMNFQRYGHDENALSMERYIGELAIDEDKSVLLRVLNDVELSRLIEQLLEGRMQENTVSIEFVDTVRKMMEREKIHSVEAEHVLEAYRYFIEGNYVVSPAQVKSKDNMPSMWSYGAKAINLLYRDHLKESLECFTEAMREHDKVSRIPGSFDSQILSFYYAICLIRCSKSAIFTRRDHIDEKLEKFLKNRDVYYGRKLAATRILLTYAKNESTQCASYVAKEVATMIQEDNCPLTRIFADILTGYFKCNENSLASEMPALGVLKHELSTFYPVGTLNKNELTKAFGGQPLLNTTRRRDDWEILFSDIRKNLIEGQKAERRLIYFLDGLWLKNIVEQTRRDDGSWDSGISVSRKQFLNEGFESMNEADRKVAAKMRVRVVDKPEASILFEELGASERLFVGEPYTQPFQPAEVEVVMPSIRFKTVGSEIYVSSNVSLDSNQRIPDKCIVSTEEFGKYKAIMLNDLQRDVLTRALSSPVLPIQAAAEVKILSERLEGILDVECELMNADCIQTREGTGTIAIRITPDEQNKNFNVQMLAAPLPEGQVRFPAGEGEDIIYDQCDSHTIAVSRDLATEQVNYELLHKFICDEIGDVFTDFMTAELSSPQSLLTLLEFAFEHQSTYMLEWPLGRELKFKGVMKPADVDVQVTTNMDWFKVQGNVHIPGTTCTFEDLLAMYRQAEYDGYIKIGDNEFMKMTEALKKNIEQLDNVIAGYDKSSKSQLVGKYDVGRLAEIFGDDGGLHAQMDEDFIGLLKKMREAYDSTPEVPVTLNATLRDYQKEGFEWMARLTSWGAGACLADDMGLGKTIQTIALMLHRAEQGPSLVVAPKSLILNWENELHKFAPTLNPVNFNNEKNKKQAIADAKAGDVFISTYGVLVTQKDILTSRQWNVICLDEAHSIKNRMTRTSRSAMALKGDAKVILTGTPLQNHLGEMWNLFQFINPGMLGPWQQFVDKYIKSPWDDMVQKELKDRTLPFILRRTKNEVLADLPEKISYEQMVELSPEELQIYEKIRKDVELKFKKHKTKAEKEEAAALQIGFFQELTRLRLLANSVSLVYPEWKPESSKIAALRDILTSLRQENGNRVLIFSQFTSFLSQIGAMMKDAGFDYLYLDGQTPLDERQRLVDSFQAGESQFFLISLKAGGLGLNLTAANYVILMDPWWNPSIEDQATDRAHRLGQERNVTVIRLVSANTIEEKILKLHEQKQDLSDKILEGTSGSAALTMDEILDMVSPYR